MNTVLLPVLLLLIFLAGSSGASAQCHCGYLRFSILDIGSGEVAPHSRAQIGRDSTGIVSGMFHVSLRAMEGPVEISVLDPKKFQLFDFPTDGGYDRLLLEVTRGEQRMSIELGNVAVEQTFVLDSIPFYPGAYSIDLDAARDRGQGHGFENIDRHMVIVRKGRQVDY